MLHLSSCLGQLGFSSVGFGSSSISHGHDRSQVINLPKTNQNGSDLTRDQFDRFKKETDLLGLLTI